MMRQRTELRIAHQQLDDLLAAPTLDEEAVKAQTRRLNELQAGMTQARVEQRLALRQVLSEEQLEKMRALRSERQGKRGPGRKGFGRGHRGGGTSAPQVQP
jgi:Spy/CpxP family protein refolding chaperone